MTGLASPRAPSIGELLQRRREGYALEAEFYRSKAIFEADMEAFFMEDWHFAAHVSEIPNPGDYVLFELLKESVIIARDASGEIHALANVCRHRGSRVCLEAQGNTKRFTCPYHAWTYNLDGSLFSARLMEAGFDKSALGLKKVAVEIFHGLIFVSFADTPRSFAQARAELDPVLAPFALDRTRIAHRETYPVKANWKLLVENYNECYHCAPAHPEYAHTHVMHMDATRAAPHNEALKPRAEALGIPTDMVDRVGSLCPPGSIDYTVSRHALHDGQDTGSRDGKPVAPLLGDLQGYDQGACDLYVGVFNPILIYNDHAVIYRFVPVDTQTSVQEIIWLVRDDAVESKDFDRDALTWLWQVTTVADKKIIEKNQEGVNSRYYEPGPLAGMEFFTNRFLDLYATRLAAHIEGPR